MAIIDSKPDNLAEVSGLLSTTDFKIKASAKSFQILSSSLYGNKIRAIVRELGTNAYDSHIAKGTPDRPFTVHLPTDLEPYFSIRDYGVGLSKEQVEQIYTTYFESTKTESNDFVGALGLGSKSPFSYTSNFLVTAIKDGVKNTFAAMVNDIGFPSIALLTTEETVDESGVEIKFSVNDSWDFSKFRDEAIVTYRSFKVIPEITGRETTIERDTYKLQDIIPGVHLRVIRGNSAEAVMGNIVYPLHDVPSAEKNLGSVAALLKFPLTINFDIGELDFQASREGLSYIPSTIAAIKSKLEKISTQLALQVNNELKVITNKWELHAKLVAMEDERGLIRVAAQEWCRNNNYEFFDKQYNNLIVNPQFSYKKASVEQINEKLNISVQVLRRQYSDRVSEDSYNTYKTRDGDIYDFRISDKYAFVINDTSKFGKTRTMYHYNNTDTSKKVVYLLNPIDKTKPMDTKKLFKQLANPVNIVNLSELSEKPKVAKTSTSPTSIGVMKLEFDKWATQVGFNWVAEDANLLDTSIRYYIPLSGYAPVTNHKYDSGNTLKKYMYKSRLAELNVAVYGVRKNFIDNIKHLPNWINVETLIKDTLTNLPESVIINIASSAFNIKPAYSAHRPEVISKVDKNSVYAEFTNLFANKADSNISAIYDLARLFDITIDTSTTAQKIDKLNQEVESKYPMLRFASSLSDAVDVIADYINMMDKISEGEVA